jgi:hypothetical protein
VASTPPVLVEMVQAGVVTELTVENGGLELEDTTESKEAKRREEKQKELAKMGAMTGLAIALHNFPEGLATFVATLADSSTGLAIAVAIALHNIPEGVCVAMPIYYATGSKWKGFWWAFLSGVSEPIGGLMGYLVRAAFPSPSLPIPSLHRVDEMAQSGAVHTAWLRDEWIPPDLVTNLRTLGCSRRPSLHPKRVVRPSSHTCLVHRKVATPLRTGELADRLSTGAVRRQHVGAGVRCVVQSGGRYDGVHQYR